MRIATGSMRLAARAACLLLLSLSTSHAVGGPQLSVVPHQERVRVSESAWVSLWDTTWWIVVSATSAQGAICRLHYSVRFNDGGDPRAMTGSWQVAAGDAAAVRGHVLVRCPTRPDYDRKLQVRLQAEACDGSRSEWQVSQFPVPSDAASPTSAMPDSAVAAAAPRLETVTTEAAADTTMEEVRAALDRAARARGGERAAGLRVVESRGERVRFAADIVPAATPAAAAALAAAATATPGATAILGEIVMPLERR